MPSSIPQAGIGVEQCIEWYVLLTGPRRVPASSSLARAILFEFAVLPDWVTATSPNHMSASALGAPPPTPTSSPERIDVNMEAACPTLNAAASMLIWPAIRHARTTL